jgi:hypothetical protein
VKGRWNDTERENIVAKFSERTSLTLYGEMNYLGAKDHICNGDQGKEEVE